jgi:hypothetical protein
MPNQHRSTGGSNCGSYAASLLPRSTTAIAITTEACLVMAEAVVKYA